MKRLAVLLVSVLIVGGLAACGGDSSTASPTPTDGSSGSSTPSASATPDASPTPDASATPDSSATSTPGQNGTEGTDAPEGTDAFTLIIESGEGAGEYTGFYDDAFPLCITGGPGPFNLVYIGPDHNGSDKDLQVTAIGSEETPDATIVEITITDADTRYEYNVAPMNSTGSATLSVKKGETFVATVEGTSAEGPEFDIMVECHDPALLD